MPLFLTEERAANRGFENHRCGRVLGGGVGIDIENYYRGFLNGSVGAHTSRCGSPEVLKDSDGKVRSWIGTIGKGSELILGNIDAQPMIRLIVTTDSSDPHFFGSRRSGLN